jgi:hypothetical protein
MTIHARICSKGGLGWIAAFPPIPHVRAVLVDT